MAGNYELNIETINIESPLLIDETSSTEYYIGTSTNNRNPSMPFWKIKRIWKVGNVWKFGYPDGKQEFKFIWDDRYSYIYT